MDFLHRKKLWRASHPLDRWSHFLFMLFKLHHEYFRFVSYKIWPGPVFSNGWHALCGMKTLWHENRIVYIDIQTLSQVCTKNHEFSIIFKSAGMITIWCLFYKCTLSSDIGKQNTVALRCIVSYKIVIFQYQNSRYICKIDIIW